MKKIMSSFAVIVLVILVGVGFTACAPTTAEKAKTKMEKAEYTTIYSYGEDDIPTTSPNGVIGMFSAVKGSILEIATGKVDFITAVYFDTTAHAKEGYDKIEEDANDLALSSFEMGRSGKIIYYGTEQGVKDFKKTF